MSNYNPIHIPGRKERERESEARRNAHHARIEPQPTDPGPGVYDVENLHRLATQVAEAPIPLDPSALDPIDVTMLDLENRAKAEMERRDMVEAALKAERDWYRKCWRRECDEAQSERRRGDARESILKAEIDQCEAVKGVLIQNLQAEQRTKRLLIWVCGLVICALFWINVWLAL